MTESHIETYKSPVTAVYRIDGEKAENYVTLKT